MVTGLWLFFQRTWAYFSAPIWWIITICNSGLGDLTLCSGFWGHQHTWVHRHTCKWNTRAHLEKHQCVRPWRWLLLFPCACLMSKALGWAPCLTAERSCTGIRQCIVRTGRLQQEKRWTALCCFQLYRFLTQGGDLCLRGIWGFCFCFLLGFFPRLCSCVVLISLFFPQTFFANKIVNN